MLEHVFLVCHNESCKSLFTRSWVNFNKKISFCRLTKIYPKFYCSKKCMYYDRKTTKDPDYVKNRLINESRRDPVTGCWIWDKKRERYGNLRLNRKSISVHKASYLLFNGPIEDDLHVRHTCHNNKCVNPEHLILGTAYDNIQDNVKAGRNAKGSRMGCSKLTEDQVLKIRKLWSLNDLTKKRKKYSAPKLSKMFGIATTNIMKIVKRESWRHI